MREKRFFTLSFPVTLTLLLTSNLGKICGTGRMDWVLRLTQPPPLEGLHNKDQDVLTFVRELADQSVETILFVARSTPMQVGFSVTVCTHLSHLSL